ALLGSWLCSQSQTWVEIKAGLRYGRLHRAEHRRFVWDFAHAHFAKRQKLMRDKQPDKHRQSTEDSRNHHSLCHGLPSALGCNYVVPIYLDDSKNWLPSTSRNIAEVPHSSVFGGPRNSMPLADISL